MKRVLPNSLANSPRVKHALFLAALILLASFVLFLIGLRLFWQSEAFQEMLQDEISYLADDHNLRVIISKSEGRGLFGFHLKGLRILRLNDAKQKGRQNAFEPIMQLESLSFNPELESFFRLGFSLNFYFRFAKDELMLASFRSRAFDFFLSSLQAWARGRYAGIWKLEMQNLSLAPFLHLFAGRIYQQKTSLLKHLTGRINAKALYRDHEPFDDFSAEAKAHLVVRDLSINQLRLSYKGRSYRQLNFKPMTLKAHFRKNALKILEPVVLQSPLGTIQWQALFNFSRVANSRRLKELKKRQLAPKAHESLPWVKGIIKGERSLLLLFLAKHFRCSLHGLNQAFMVRGLADKSRCYHMKN